MQSQPLIGVVLIFLDAEAYIAEAIDSVCGQSYPNWELILVDDGSRDNSTTIAKDYAARFSNIRYVEHAGHENRGMSASRNLGARETQAPFLAFIDADDIWRSGKLAEQMAILTRHPQAALVLGALEYWYSWLPGSGMDRVLLTAGVADRLLQAPHAFVRADPVGIHPGAGVDFLARREAFDAVGGFEENFRGLYEDQAFFAKIFLTQTIYIARNSWLRYRQHPRSCVAVADGDGSYAQARAAYFDWLTATLARLHPDTALLHAITRARANGPWRRIGLRLAKWWARQSG